MHVCHVITRLIIGGAQENTILTCRGLVGRGHRVTLIAGPETGPEGSLWDDAERSGAELIKLESLVREVSPLTDRRARRDLIRLFRKLQPDVVHTHSSKAGIVGRLAAAKAGVPAIIHTIHGMSFNRTQPWVVRRFYRALERRAAKVTTTFVSVAHAMTDQAVAAGIAPQDKFITVYSGMQTERYAPDGETRKRVRQGWGVGPDETVVGTIARLFRNKGYEDILAAMKRVAGRRPNLRFVWIGGGPFRERYEQRLDRLGLRPRVHFTGLIRPDEVARQLNGFDMLIHASRWEGLPRTVVQALLTEVPPICYDIDGASEVVVPEQTGILVPCGNTRKLAEAIVTLAEDPARCRRMGELGRSRCEAMFGWESMVEKLEGLYLATAPPDPLTLAGHSRR